jgi:hypothetical protein
MEWDNVWARALLSDPIVAELREQVRAKGLAGERWCLVWCDRPETPEIIGFMFHGKQVVALSGQPQGKGGKWKYRVSAPVSDSRVAAAAEDMFVRAEQIHRENNDSAYGRNELEICLFDRGQYKHYRMWLNYDHLDRIARKSGSGPEAGSSGAIDKFEASTLLPLAELLVKLHKFRDACN